VKLLVRTTRRISLDARGQRRSSRLPAPAGRLGERRGQRQRRRRQGQRHLRITSPAGFGRRHVAPLVPRFLAAAPEVSLSLNLSTASSTSSTRASTCAVRVGDLPDSSLVSVRLADNRRLCVAPAY
jgi:DNA-binding transcriptional LysR family regulator